MNQPLTDRQTQLHAYLCERWNDPPTFREMCAHMGGVQINCITGMLEVLAKKGYIEKPDDRRSRGIKLLIGPDLDGTDIEIAGRMYRLVSKEERITYLYCDGASCEGHEPFDVNPDPRETAAQQRKRAQETAGWHRKGGRDLCWGCWTEERGGT